MKLTYDIQASNLRALRHKPDEGVVETLEYYLEEAKAGRLDAVLILGSGRHEDGTPCGWSKCAGNANLGEVIDAFEIWKFRKLRDATEGE